MKIRFTLLGVEVAVIDLEFPTGTTEVSKTIDKGVKKMSNWWTKRMTA